MAAKVIWPDGRYSFNASADVAPGDVVVRPCGTLAIHDCPVGAKSGERINPVPLNPGQIVQLDSASATTIAVGVAVYVIAATKLATGVSSGNVYAGKAIQAKTSGQTSVLVNTAAPAA